MSARLLLAVLASTLALCVPNSARADEADAIRKATALLEAKMWKVAKVVPSANGVGGSILVSRSKDGINSESMWLDLSEKTPFTLNGRLEGVRVSDIQVGMSVAFEFGGLAKTHPPQPVGLTGVAVFGKENHDPRELRERLLKEPAKK